MTDATTPAPADSKEWWKSKTVIGAAVAILASVLGLVFNTNVDADTQSQIVELIVSGGGIFGGIWAIIGRLTAKKTLA